MRTTLDIDDDVLQAAKELARHRGSTAGRVLSELARRALCDEGSGRTGEAQVSYGVPVIPAEGRVVTDEMLGDLADREGI